MSFSTNVSLAQLNEITTKNYGFHVFNWDKNRGQGENAGRMLVAKHAFGTDRTVTNGTTRELITLNGMSKEKIAEVFNNIFQRNTQSPFGNPKSIHLRVCADDTIPSEPFLFILGNKRAKL